MATSHNSGRVTDALPVFPATVNTPEETFAHGQGYMLNTSINALTAIPISTERLKEIDAKKGGN